MIRRLFWDIEVSPNIVLSWNIGYNLRLGEHTIVKERAIICIAYKWEHEEKIHVLHWDARQSDKAMLRQFLAVLAEADEVVYHNGDRFDMKWVRTRCLYHELPPYPDHKSVDTLKLAWSKFNFNSSKLDYIAKFLGIPGKTSTGFDLWRKILLDRDPEALAKMAEYCVNDVVVLQAVYQRLKLWTKPQTHAGVVAGNAAWSCPHCASEAVRKSKTRVSASGTLSHQMRCNGCGSFFTVNASTYKAYAETKSH